MIGNDGCQNVTASGTFLFLDDGRFEMADRPPKKVRKLLAAGNFAAWSAALYWLHEAATSAREAARKANEEGDTSEAQ